MNLQEMAAALPAKGLRAKLLQQERQIKQLQEENRWLREQLAKATKEDKKKRQHSPTHRSGFDYTM